MQKIYMVWKFVRDLGRTLRSSSRAVGTEGVSLPRQFYELVRLRLGAGKLSPTDYYQMQLYRRDLTFAQKRQYISVAAMNAMAWDKRWGIVADDKLLAYSLLASQGIRVPEVQAIFHPVRSYGAVPALRSEEELEDYLIGRATYPFFSKPIQGIFSQNTLLVKAFDGASRTLLLGDGSSVPLREFTRQYAKRSKGYLMQELLHPHADIAALCGERLCTVRFIVLVDKQGPRVFRALWKIAAPQNMADNYWRPGNMLALLDMTTGAVQRCTSGFGPEMKVIERHPVSGQPLPGFTLPCWGEVVDLTLRAARTIPAIPIQAWDIALTSKGPMPLEVNIFGSPNLPQISAEAGLLQGEFRAFIEAQKR